MNNRIAYILFPLEMLGEWVPQAEQRFSVDIRAIIVADWDNELTPWPSPGVPTGNPDFQGLAPQYLEYIRTQVVPVTERGKHYARRDLIGVSLSGLFAMWQWTRCDLFDNIASISGSFWYPGFADWFAAHCPDKKGGAYLSLGKQEPHSPVPQFRPVGVDTQRVVDILAAHNIRHDFQWVPGNHYQHGIERLDLAFSWLYDSGL